MRLRPTGGELLAAARTVLRESLLPSTSSEDDRQALLAMARTMAVVENELEFEQPGRPDDLERLEAARVLLREKLLPRLPQDRRYDARLVAKAMAVAAAELRLGEALERTELAGLAALLDEPPQPAADVLALRGQVAALGARFAGRIRGGGFDPGTSGHAAAVAHLRATTHGALAVSNPAYLKARAPSTAPALPRV
jgi:hypothetical protein